VGAVRAEAATWRKAMRGFSFYRSLGDHDPDEILVEGRRQEKSFHGATTV
jgi:hypothetical protein